jgi:hypothetical protein
MDAAKLMIGQLKAIPGSIQQPVSGNKPEDF